MKTRVRHLAVWLLGVGCACPAHALWNVTLEQNRVGLQEEMYIPIGGLDQWITIKGDDRNNPVVLFLHGGPGDALSPTADVMFAGWEKQFTLVQWDQRGAGRTFTKNGTSIEPTMTVERMAQDGIEVAHFLQRHLDKKKIILVGVSWGSILGIYMCRTEPGLFYAYLGLAQMVNWQQNLAASYGRVLGMARSVKDEQAIAALTAIGAPPWHAVSVWPKFRKWERLYQAKVVTAAPAPSAVSPTYASPEEQAQNEAADDFSFMHFWGNTLSGPFTKVNLAALGTDFTVPIFIVQGEQDLTAVPELAKAYFDSIKAPRKQFYLVPGTGHGLTAPELVTALNVLTEQVRPTALRAPDRISLENFVRIGGIEQWISIRGDDAQAPVLLVLHGGPGAAWSGFPMLDASWEKSFIIVRWDQRGAGRTFGRSGPVGREITIDRMVQDGVDVTEYLRRVLHRDRVILMGVSWGSVLGLEMAKSRPDLFYAYVGTGQIVDWLKGEALAYARVLAKARSANDETAITALEKIGPPPYVSQRSLGVRSNWSAHFEPGAPTNAELFKIPFSAPGYSKVDAQNWLDGLTSSQDHFFGDEMDGPLTRVDLITLGLHFDVPIFFLQGIEDDVTPAAPVEAYAHSLSAPHVEYVPLEDAGHYAFMTKSDLFVRLLNERVRPLALEHR